MTADPMIEDAKVLNVTDNLKLYYPFWNCASARNES
jgi:hypothetical protein